MTGVCSSANAAEPQLSLGCFFRTHAQCFTKQNCMRTHMHTHAHTTHSARDVRLTPAAAVLRPALHCSSIATLHIGFVASALSVRSFVLRIRVCTVQCVKDMLAMQHAMCILSLTLVFQSFSEDAFVVLCMQSSL